MSLFKDILFAVPIGILLNVVIHQITNVMYGDLPYKERFQKSLITVFIAGILAIVLALTLFNNSFVKNNAMKIGFIFGGILLLFYSLIYNWDKMDDDTKLFIFGLVFGAAVYYCYKKTATNVTPQKKTKKRKSKQQLQKVEFS